MVGKIVILVIGFFLLIKGADFLLKGARKFAEITNDYVTFKNPKYIIANNLSEITVDTRENLLGSLGREIKINFDDKLKD